MSMLYNILLPSVSAQIVTKQDVTFLHWSTKKLVVVLLPSCYCHHRLAAVVKCSLASHTQFLTLHKHVNPSENAQDLHDFFLMTKLIGKPATVHYITNLILSLPLIFLRRSVAPMFSAPYSKSKLLWSIWPTTLKILQYLELLS